MFGSCALSARRVHMGRRLNNASTRCCTGSALVSDMMPAGGLDGSGPESAAGLSSAALESPRARKVSGWPKRCKLAHAFLWECNCYKGLKLAQLLGQPGVFLTPGGTRRTHGQVTIRCRFAHRCRGPQRSAAMRRWSSSCRNGARRCPHCRRRHQSLATRNGLSIRCVWSFRYHF